MFDRSLGEFNSPITSIRQGEQATPAVAATVANVVTIPGLNPDQTLIDRAITAFKTDAAFRWIVTTLLDRSSKDRDAMRRTADFWWCYLTGTERGRIVKGFLPDRPDNEIAAMAWVARETLVTDDGYQHLKKRLSDKPPATTQWRGRNRRRIVLARMIASDPPLTDSPVEVSID